MKIDAQNGGNRRENRLHANCPTPWTRCVDHRITNPLIMKKRFTPRWPSPKEYTAF